MEEVKKHTIKVFSKAPEADLVTVMLLKWS
jgi:hypothetical protein